MDNKDAIIINVVGDFVAKRPDLITLSEDCKSYLKKADYNICNFEAPIEGFKEKIKKSGPSLCQSVHSPSFLESIGFNIVLLANNHIMDYGRQACMASIRSFNNSITVGVGSIEEAYSVKIIEKGGTKIGIISIVQHEFGVIEDSRNGYGTAWINSDHVKPLFDKYRDLVDYLFVFPHAGIEYIDVPLPEWRVVYKEFIDWGADAVIASHPHVPQGWEYYRDRPIFYSLGNFYFDCLGGKPYWNNGLLVSISINQKDIKFQVQFLSVSNNRIGFDNSEEFSRHIIKINEILNNDSLYQQIINDEIQKLGAQYKYGLLRGIAGVGRMRLSLFFKLLAGFILNKKDPATLLNMFRCESHRWVFQRYLSDQISFY